MSTNQQTVAGNPNTDDKSGEGTGAPEQSLDELLSEYSSDTSTSTDSGEDLSKEDLTALRREIQDYRSEKAQDEEMRAINDVAHTVVEEARLAGVQLTEDSIADEFSGWAARNKGAVVPAYLDRHSNPKKWNDITAAWRRERITKASSQPDAATTASVDAMHAAVQGASDKAPERGMYQDLSDLSDLEFEKLKRRAAKGQ